MTYIDKSYFIGTLNIPQKSDANSGVDGLLTRYINIYEDDFLTKALGYEFSQYVKAHETEARFVKLIQGDTYNIADRDITGKWIGFQNDLKVSPIANYVYWYYWRDKAQDVGGSTIIQTKTENATVVSPIEKMVTAWNEMIEMVKGLYRYLYANMDLYPEFKINQTYCLEPQNSYNL